MLFFHWNEHPLFYSSKTKSKKIAKAQIKAIKSLTKYFEENAYNPSTAAHKYFITQTMVAFLKDSQLLELTLNSLGSSLSELNH